MKILYIGAFRFPNGDAAGARVLNNARAIRMAGHEVEFIAWGGQERIEDLCQDGLYRYDGFVYQVTEEINLYGSKLHKFKQVLTEGCKTKSILQKRNNSFDAIIYYNGHYEFTKYLLHLSKLTGAKLIHDITEWYAPDEIPLLFRWSYRRNMVVLQHHIPNKICISTYLYNYYSESNNILLPALCDVSENKWTTHQPEKLPDIVKEFKGVKFIYAGTPAKKDLLHNVINVINKMVKEGVSIMLLILGSTRNEYITEFSDKLKDTNLHDNIVFLGRVHQTDVASYYRLADFMVLLREPTRKSLAGFPTKFAEAMTSGTPVCANITSDIGMYLKDGQNGIVVPDYTEESFERTLRQRIIYLTPETITSMKQNAKSMAKTHFDYRAYVGIIKQFIDELI